MKVKDLMSTNVACVTEDTPVSQIAHQMRKNNIGSLPVCDSTGHVKGIITDRDLAIRVLANPKRPAEDIKASDIMSLNPITIQADINIHDAALIFAAHKIRRLPVTEASRIMGILSLGDIAVKPVYIDEAGDALSAISLTDDPQAQN